MKKIRKESLLKGLRYTIDLALILEFIGLVYVIFQIVTLSTKNPVNDVINETTVASISSPPNNIMISFSNPELGKYLPSIEKTLYKFFNYCGLVNVIVLILITLQLKYIFKSFTTEDYFNPSNSIRIKKIAIVIFIWVLVDYAIRFYPLTVLPHYTVHCTLGLNTFSAGVLIGLEGLNIKMLLVSLIIYMLSIVFSYGHNLKEESTFTI
jgi:hypothetical protein